VKRQLAAATAYLMRFLYTQNPFYLIGTLLVLYGLQQSFGQNPTFATSSLLVGLLAGYTLVLAAIAALIIGWGRVWDDARTILLVIVLLFFMLSTSLDFHLLFTLEEPLPGTLFLAAGLAFSVVVSESVLRSLKIGLPACFRGPYYLILTLLFAYPAMLGWMNYYSRYSDLAWALLAFPIVAANALLTLLPAASTPPWKEFKSGTPWKWPFYPWSLFVYLTIGVAIRAWWLTIAFEPAKGPDAYFKPYFLLPLVLAWSALVLEMGQARRSNGAISAALLLPLTGLMIGFPGPGQNPVEVVFLDRLTQAIGSPAQLTVWSLLGFYGWAWLRREQFAEGFLIALGLLAAVVGPQTLDWATLSAPQPLVLGIVALAIVVRAILLESTWRAGLAGAAMVVAARMAGLDSSAMTGASLWFWQWHAPIVALLAIIAIFNDELATILRSLAWRATPCLAIVAAVVYPWTMPGVLQSAVSGYAMALLIVSIALWVREKHVAALGALFLTIGANLLASVRPVYTLLSQTMMAEGLVWLASGLSIVLVALLISLVKMGAWLSAWNWLERLNQGLTSTRDGPTH
jgi:hypothetical protein